MVAGSHSPVGTWQYDDIILNGIQNPGVVHDIDTDCPEAFMKKRTCAGRPAMQVYIWKCRMSCHLCWSYLVCFMMFVFCVVLGTWMQFMLSLFTTQNKENNHYSGHSMLTRVGLIFSTLRNAICHILNFMLLCRGIKSTTTLVGMLIIRQGLAYRFQRYSCKFSHHTLCDKM